LSGVSWDMATPAGDVAISAALTELSERQRERALDRYRKLRPHLEHDVPLAGVAKEASLPFRTAQRWVSRFRRFGLIGLIRAGRADQGKRRRVPDDLRRFTEGLALERPPLGPSAIYREVWPASHALAANRRRDISRSTT
jgi:putative transposase